MADGSKPGRNDRCPCGSGRKFKHCCGSGVAKPGSNAEADRLVRLAQPHLQAGRYEQAVGPLLRAAQLVPDSPAIFADLGKACLFTRRLPEAINCLRRSIALQPGVAETHHTLGHALEQSGDLDAALAAHRRATELSPGHARAHGRVGDILTGKGRRDGAAVAYELASAASPDTTFGRLCCAKASILRDRPGVAEEQLRALVARDGSNAEAHLVLGLVLNEAGRFDEAGASFERSIALSPGQATAHHGLVSSRRLTDVDRPVVERILERLAGPPMTETQRMTLHFAAGKAFDDLKDYAAAIHHFDAANEIRRRIAPFDRELFARVVGRIVSLFSPELFARGAAAREARDGDDETAVLVLGMPRSGTTLIERIVSSHPQVAGGGELTFWNEHAPALVDLAPDALPAVLDPVRSDYLRLLRGIGPGSLRVTDKMPFNFLWVGLVHLALPRARIVHCRRNPIGTCLSIYQTQFAQNWGFASDRGDLAFYHRQYLRLMDHWRAVLPPERLIDVDYEDATQHPEAIAQRLIAFCGLPWDPACARPERNPDAVRTASKWQARQPIYSSSVDRWRHYEPWLGELRELG